MVLHLRRPLKESPQISTLSPGKFPELQKADLLHLNSAVGLDSPKQIPAAPRGQVMTTSSVPQKSHDINHPRL
jgi:hypothetical protein